MLYGLLQNALRGTMYSANITEFEKTKNGREAYFRLAERFGGTKAWENAHSLTVTAWSRKWKSNGDITLSKHTATLRDLFEKQVRICKHTNYTPKNGREKVIILMDSIDNDDPLLTAHIAKVNSDIPGLGSDFEGTVTLLVAVDPVARKHEKSADKKKKGPLISSTIAGRGEKTGVDLRWYNG